MNGLLAIIRALSPSAILARLLTVDYTPRDDRFGITGSVDTSKVWRLEVDGLTTATTRTRGARDVSGNEVVDSFANVFSQANTFGGGTLAGAPADGANQFILARGVMRGASDIITGGGRGHHLKVCRQTEALAATFAAGLEFWHDTSVDWSLSGSSFGGSALFAFAGSVRSGFFGSGTAGTITYAFGVGGNVAAGGGVTITNGAAFYAYASTGTVTNKWCFYGETGSGAGAMLDGLSLGTATLTAGNGLLQFLSGTTKANGIAWGTDVFLYRDAASSLTTDGDLRLSTVGRGLRVKEGTNGKMGQATLVAGTVTIANTSITANSRIFVTVSTAGGTQGFLRTSKIAATSFTITSTNAAETSVVDWFIVEPS